MMERRVPATLFPYTTLFRSHRHVYGEQWIKFMKDGVNALFTINVTMTVQQECRDRKSGSSRNAETDLVCRLLLEKKNKKNVSASRALPDPADALWRHPIEST